MEQGASLHHRDFIPEDRQEARPRMQILYREVHYEILYKSGEGIGENFEEAIQQARSLSTEVEINVVGSGDEL